MRLPDDLRAQVRTAAAARGVTVTAFVEEALRLALAGREQAERSEPYRVHPLPAGRGLQPGVDLDDRASLQDLMDDADTWDEHLGGFYDVDGVRHLLSSGSRPITEQAVSARRGLLTLTTGSGRVVHPIFQFAGSAVVDGLDEVLAVLPEHLVSRWTLASWLVSVQDDLGGESAMALLRDGAAARVVGAARRWATALAA